MSFRDLVNRVATKVGPGGCGKCKLDKSLYVPSEIHSGSEIAVVGEAPGATEVSVGKPFVGKSGQLLRKALTVEGLDGSSILNVVRCRPPKNRTPHAVEVKTCGKRNLIPELTALGPKVIVLAGGAPFSYFFNGTELSKSRGNFRTQGSFTFMTTFHPATILYAGGLTSKGGKARYRAICKDFEKVRKFIDGTLYSDREYHTVTTREDAEKWRDFLLTQNKLSVDIEATSLRSWHAGSRVLMVGFSWAPKKAVCFPIHHREIEDEQFRAFSEESIKTVLKTDSEKTWHNRKYDDPYLSQMGFEINGRPKCTMLMAYLTDENRRHYSLKALTAQYLEGYSDIVDDFVNCSLEKMGYYNCEDADNTGRIETLLGEKMDEGLWNVHDKIVMPAVRSLGEMEHVGVLVDIETVKTMRKDLEKESKEAIIKINKAMPAGKTCTSDLDLRELLFDSLGYPVIKKTPKGAASVDKHVLQELSEDHGCAIAAQMLMVRANAKLISTYLKPWPTFVEADGRIHCNFNLHKTVTGRISADDPNLLNIPRRKDIRRLIIARPGWVLIDGDLSNAEMRVAASLAEEKTLIQAFIDGADIHILTASQVNDIPLEAVTKEQRQGAKPVNFGFLYRQLAKGFQGYAKQNYGISFTLDEAERFRDKYFSTYWGLPIWYEKVLGELHAEGQVRTKTGRLRRLPNVYSDNRSKVLEAERMAINTLVQSLSSDLCLMIVNGTHQEIIKRGLKGHVVLSVYDSVMVECPPEECPEIARIIHDITVGFERFEWLKVPMKMDLEVGPRWKETETITADVNF